MHSNLFFFCIHIVAISPMEAVAKLGVARPSPALSKVEINGVALATPVLQHLL